MKARDALPLLERESAARAPVLDTRAEFRARTNELLIALHDATDRLVTGEDDYQQVQATWLSAWDALKTHLRKIGAR